MYDSLHNAKQMLPNVMLIQLPDPLPDTKDVICYDFVPQLLSILQKKEMMSANNLVLDPNNPLAIQGTK
jgi:phage tail protein X